MNTNKNQEILMEIRKFAAKHCLYMNADSNFQKNNLCEWSGEKCDYFSTDHCKPAPCSQLEYLPMEYLEEYAQLCEKYKIEQNSLL